MNTVPNIDSCWRQARFKKAVLVVIDALRYDFMVYNESLEAENALSFQNKLGVIDEVLNTKPAHGRIFQFVADPPTTTMQRIKGLTTGGFVEGKSPLIQCLFYPLFPPGNKPTISYKCALIFVGSLPTFVDAGSNFASAEIHEDNIIAQLKDRGKKVVFMGDDTWMGLFPGKE
jgi:phosphatidylinositol glycan class O